jgi:hypothetical protein
MLLEISENLRNAQFHLILNGLIVAVILLLPNQTKAESETKRKQSKR